MKSSREHEDEGYLSVRESGESARLPAPQAAVILLSTIVARGGSNRHAQHGAREAAASVPPAQGSLPVAAGAAWPAPSAAGGDTALWQLAGAASAVGRLHVQYEYMLA